MLNSYTFNIQESLKHAWHGSIGFFKVLGSENVKALSIDEMLGAGCFGCLVGVYLLDFVCSGIHLLYC